MSQRQTTVNVCEVCAHEWIPKLGVTYTHCTSGKCRSRKWNSGAPQGGARPPKPSLVGSSPTAPAKECSALGGLHARGCKLAK